MNLKNISKRKPLLRAHASRPFSCFPTFMKRGSKEGELKHNKLERKMRCTIYFFGGNDEVNNRSHVSCNNILLSQLPIRV